MVRFMLWRYAAKGHKRHRVNILGEFDGAAFSYCGELYEKKKYSDHESDAMARIKTEEETLRVLGDETLVEGLKEIYGDEESMQIEEETESYKYDA